MKTIMISDEVYKKLASIKKGKSFTELLSELVDKTKPKNIEELLKFGGTMSHEQAKEMTAIAKQIRKRAKRRVYETTSRH